MFTLFRTILTKLKYYYRVKRLYQYPFQSPGLSLRFKSLLFVSICTAPTTFTKPVHIYCTYIHNYTRQNPAQQKLKSSRYTTSCCFYSKKRKEKKDVTYWKETPLPSVFVCFKLKKAIPVFSFH